MTFLQARPTLNQVQIIQSLGEALSWFEKEIGWGVSPASLGHLTGRIGELYVAMISRGQMALTTNQNGYDVVSALNERISVKTVTTSNNVKFRLSTFDQVDRVVVLRVGVSEDTGVFVEELLDLTSVEARDVMREVGSDLVWTVPSRRQREERPLEGLAITARAIWQDIELVRYESGAVRVRKNAEIQNLVVKDVLRLIAPEVGLDVLNSKGEPKNTQVLGADVIRALNSKQTTPPH